jgi:hypothetical protein
VTAAVVWSSSDGGGGGEREGIHRAVVCVKKDITLRDRPSGTPLRTLGTGTGVNVHRDRGRGAWWYVSTDDGHSGWALSQHLPSTCALN